MSGPRRSFIAVNSLLAVLMLTTSALAQGIILPVAGAVNRSMGGATTGTAVEALGSMYWNPATINRLESDEVGFGFELLYSNSELSSTFPGVGSGSTDGEIGAVPAQNIAWVHHLNHPDLTIGLGLFTAGGFSASLPADPTNPILSPPPSQGGVGVGRLKSDAMFFEVTTAISVQVTDRVSVAIGPILGMSKITIDESPFLDPNANGAYPEADGSRYHWGGGAQLGIHYVHNCCWEFGANIKSPIWFEPIRYFSEDVNGQSRVDTIHLTLPMIVSGGLAYRGFEFILLTADFRYLDYTSTEGFGDSASYRNNGSVNGLGWNDLFSMALGSEFQLTERLTSRAGYIFISDLIDSDAAFFNVASDLSYQHIISFGASYSINDNATLSAAYGYVAPWGASGPYVLPGTGVVPGSNVESDFDTHILTMGLNVTY